MYMLARIGGLLAFLSLAIFNVLSLELSDLFLINKSNITSSSAIDDLLRTK